VGDSVAMLRVAYGYNGKDDRGGEEGRRSDLMCTELIESREGPEDETTELEGGEDDDEDLGGLKRLDTCRGLNLPWL